MCVNKYFSFNAKQWSLLKKHISGCSCEGKAYRPRTEIKSAGKCLMSSSGFMRKMKKQTSIGRSFVPTLPLLYWSKGACAPPQPKTMARASSLITKSITDTRTYKHRKRQTVNWTHMYTSIHPSIHTHLLVYIHACTPNLHTYPTTQLAFIRNT